MRGVKNGPSPDWLQARLKAIGLRPINALVDITNYISFDRGRPLHVYDADKLTGAIRARLGKTGESFLALDGKTYEVDEEMCVIADDSGVLGLGGVIGGEDTGCTEETTNVFIESAYFDPKRTARTGRKLNIISDARFRFERGVDPQSVRAGPRACHRDGARSVRRRSQHRRRSPASAPKANAPFRFDMRLIGRLSGLSLSDREIQRNSQGAGHRSWKATAKCGKPRRHPGVPTFPIPADLVEEVVRLTGVDRIPATPLPRLSGVAKPVLTPAQKQARAVRRLPGRAWSRRGRHLVVHPARMRRALFGGGDAALALDNPISTELSQMRPSLLPGLISAAKRNRDRGFADGALFELGQAYRGLGADDQFTAASRRALRAIGACRRGPSLVGRGA